MNVIIGTNDFYGVPFPLVLFDRFLHIYGEGRRWKLDIFRWDEQTQSPTYEVIGNQPQEDSITTNPTGIVTFSHPETECFLYKFRPKPGISQLFGRVPVENQYEIYITDRVIMIMPNAVEFRRNQVHGCYIGLRIRPDGAIEFGSNWLPEGITLMRQKT